MKCMKMHLLHFIFSERSKTFVGLVLTLVQDPCFSHNLKINRRNIEHYWMGFNPVKLYCVINITDCDANKTSQLGADALDIKYIFVLNDERSKYLQQCLHVFMYSSCNTPHLLAHLIAAYDYDCLMASSCYFCNAMTEPNKEGMTSRAVMFRWTDVNERI